MTGKPTIETAGLIALRAAMEKRGMRPEDLRKAIGIKSLSVVGRWLNGKRRPDIDSAARIERLLAVPASSWEHQTLADVEPAKAGAA